MCSIKYRHEDERTTVLAVGGVSLFFQNPEQREHRVIGWFRTFFQGLDHIPDARLPAVPQDTHQPQLAVGQVWRFRPGHLLNSLRGKDRLRWSAGSVN